MFSSVKIINTLCLLLTCFYNLSICVFMIWLASQTSWLELFNEPSRASLLARLYNEPNRANMLTSRAITSRAVTSRLGSLSCPYCCMLLPPLPLQHRHRFGHDLERVRTPRGLACYWCSPHHVKCTQNYYYILMYPTLPYLNKTHLDQSKHIQHQNPPHKSFQPISLRDLHRVCMHWSNSGSE